MRKQKEVMKIFEEIIAETIPNLMKNINSHIQETHWNSTQDNKRDPYLNIS